MDKSEKTFDGAAEGAEDAEGVMRTLKPYALAGIALQFADLVSLAVKRDGLEGARFGSCYLYGAVAVGNVALDTRNGKFSRVMQSLAFGGLAAMQAFSPQDWKRRAACVASSAIFSIASLAPEEYLEKIRQKIEYGGETIYYTIFRNKKPLGR